MQKFIFLFIILSFGFLYCQDNNKKFWIKDSLLTWEDFRGIPTMSKVAALSYCGIRFQSCSNLNVQSYHYQVTAYFQKNLSWGWKNSQNIYVLEHEQLHFDLAEVYTRKIRKYFFNNKIKIKHSIAVYKKFYKKYILIQDMYDEETWHGINEKKQAEWKIKIEEWLEELVNFTEDKCY